MSEDVYVMAIAALLPLTAGMLVTQVNPYHALVIRGILGAVAALVYALFGAADVALTEALVGTMLSITLYAIAVRSSMSMRLGILESSADEVPVMLSEQVYPALRKILYKYHMRLEVMPYPSVQALQFALENKEVHGTCVAIEHCCPEADTDTVGPAPYHLNIRLKRLYDIVDGALPPALATVNFSRALRLMPSTESSASTRWHEVLEGQP
jgi:putative multicomponent Na+:H+ antiporter subunit B